MLQSKLHLLTSAGCFQGPFGQVAKKAQTQGDSTFVPPPMGAQRNLVPLQMSSRPAHWSVTSSGLFTLLGFQINYLYMYIYMLSFCCHPLSNMTQVLPKRYGYHKELILKKHWVVNFHACSLMITDFQHLWAMKCIWKTLTVQWLAWWGLWQCLRDLHLQPRPNALGPPPAIVLEPVQIM